jgi:hypothetical protein
MHQLFLLFGNRNVQQALCGFFRNLNKMLFSQGAFTPTTRPASSFGEPIIGQ